LKKELIGIFVCMLFLFSSLPAVQSTNIDNNKIEPVLKTNYTNNQWGFIYVAYFGIIKNNGEEFREEPLWCMCYNVTPINARFIGIAYSKEVGFSIDNQKITDEPFYIPKDGIDWNLGFIGKNLMFFGLFEWLPY